MKKGRILKFDNPDKLWEYIIWRIQDGYKILIDEDSKGNYIFYEIKKK